MAIELDAMDAMHEEVVNACRKSGVSIHIAVDIARSVETNVRRRCGGGRHYIAITCANTRNSCLYVDYQAGVKLDVMAKKYDLTERHIRRILKDQFGVS